MKEIKVGKFILIKLLYGVLIVIFLISVFLPYYSRYYAFPPPPADPIVYYTRPYFGYNELIYGGWPGLILTIISIIILNPERKGKSLLIGGVGFSLILINLMIRPAMQTITIEVGFYLGLVIGISLFVINIFAFKSKEGEISLISDRGWDREPIVTTTPTINKMVEMVEVSWEEKEIIKTQTIDYIKKMQLKVKELPFYEIITNTGIDRDDLKKVVSDMRSNKEINAQVRDFVIIFKEIPKGSREEELEKIRNDLQQKLSEIDKKIQERKLDKAIVELQDIISVAKSFKLENLVLEVREKIELCRELIKVQRKEEEILEIKEKIQIDLSKIDELIEKDKMKTALKNLEKIKTTAVNHNLSDILEQVDNRITQCKTDESEKIKKKAQIKIKNTILKYGSKLARLELMDVSEKSGIQDEKLIEEIILEMIENQEINGEYFSSSKSLAFYKQETDAKQTSIKEEVSKLRVFLSYSTLDAEHFNIVEIVKALEKYPEIKKTSYWQADSKQNIVEFMENTLKNTDVFVLFCSKNSVKSNAVKDEWQAAFQLRKKGALKIVPVYYDEDDIPVLLLQLLNVKFEKDNFDGFIGNLYEEILR